MKLSLETFSWWYHILRLWGLALSQFRNSFKAKDICIYAYAFVCIYTHICMQFVRLSTEFLLRFFKYTSNMGLTYLSDLIKILYITQLLKGNSQMLSGLVGYYYTLKLNLHTYIITLFIWCSFVILKDNAWLWSNEMDATSYSVSLLFSQNWVCSSYLLMRIIK